MDPGNRTRRRQYKLAASTGYRMTPPRVGSHVSLTCVGLPGSLEKTTRRSKQMGWLAP